jgi:GST-like protein
MATWGWASLWEGQQQTLEDKPHMARWLDACLARPGLRAGRLLHADKRRDTPDLYIKRLRGTV